MSEKEITLFSIKKKAKRYEVGIQDGNQKFFFKISEDLLIECHLLSYKKLSEVEYLTFLNKIPLDSLVFEGLKYLNKKSYSEKELFDHLYHLSPSKDLVDSAISILKNKGLVDDSAFLKNYLDYAMNVKKEGRKKILLQMSLYGLSNQSFFYPEDILRENVIFLTKKYNEQTKNLPKKMKIDRCKAFLIGKGYSEEDLEHYFDFRLISADDEIKMIQKDYRKLSSKFKNDYSKIQSNLLRKGYSSYSISKVLGGYADDSTS